MRFEAGRIRLIAEGRIVGIKPVQIGTAPPGGGNLGLRRGRPIGNRGENTLCVVPSRAIPPAGHAPPTVTQSLLWMNLPAIQNRAASINSGSLRRPV
jgi:hypothetical protein